MQDVTGKWVANQINIDLNDHKGVNSTNELERMTTRSFTMKHWGHMSLASLHCVALQLT